MDKRELTNAISELKAVEAAGVDVRCGIDVLEAWLRTLERFGRDCPNQEAPGYGYKIHSVAIATGASHYAPHSKGKTQYEADENGLVYMPHWGITTGGKL